MYTLDYYFEAGMSHINKRADPLKFKYFLTPSKCFLDFNLRFKFIRVARTCVIKRYIYMFCTIDCFQVHPVIVDMIIKSDTSAIKIIVHRISKY